MGDRALVVFTDGEEVSPVIYAHWAGDAIPELLATHRDLMKDRRGDVSYAAARFCGLLHEHVPGNLSVGLFTTPPVEQQAVTILANPYPEWWTKEQMEASDKAYSRILEEYSHGDAGLIVVNVKSYTWRAYGGYLQNNRAPFRGDE